MVRGGLAFRLWITEATYESVAAAVLSTGERDQTIITTSASGDGAESIAHALAHS